MSMFDSPRDQVLHAMALEGWANESTGDVESPVGWFARVSTSAEELAEVTDAFAETIAEAGLADTSELVGDFVLWQDSNGLQYVEGFTLAGAVAEYARRESVYLDWEDGDGR